MEERIIVKQLEEDLYDGQVLQKLLGESTGVPSKRLQWGHPGEEPLNALHGAMGHTSRGSP